EELWVKIIEIDIQRRRISLSIKQAADGGEVSKEYREAFGEHAYDAEGNYIGTGFEAEFTPDNESQAAWAEYAEAAPSAAGEDGAVSVEEPAANEEASEVPVEAALEAAAETPAAEASESL
ncbi:MAG: 30S ribosomal protein S1, partial [Actinobacteria bacterium]|nr:30S ribosomal protein S1 [Actinomycetota bacterium]